METRIEESCVVSNARLATRQAWGALHVRIARFYTQHIVQLHRYVCSSLADMRSIAIRSQTTLYFDEGRSTPVDFIRIPSNRPNLRARIIWCFKHRRVYIRFPVHVSYSWLVCRGQLLELDVQCIGAVAQTGI
jgi:hypothetical protein